MYSHMCSLYSLHAARLISFFCIAISSWIIIASVSGAVLLLCLFIVCCLVLLTCLYSSHCVWCPCNRKRGQARLQYMGSRGAISSHSTMNISKKQTNTGVTIYHGTSRREMVSHEYLYCLHAN